MPSIGKLKSELTLDSRKFNKGLGSARKKMKGFTRSLGSMQVGLLSVFGAAAVSAFVRNTLKSADAIGKFSDRIGISTTALQEWRFAFDKAGLSAAETDKGLLNFVKNLGEARQGTGTLVTFLNKFDKSLLQVLQSENDNTRALEVLFQALGKTENQADKVALANAALGRSGKQMVAAFNKGTTSFENWIKRGRELGVVIDDKLIRGSEDLNDQISAVSQAISAQFKTAFLESTPVILEFTQALADALVQLNEFFNPSLEEQYKRLVAQGELALEVIKELEGGSFNPFTDLDTQRQRLEAINKELEELQAKMRQEVTIKLEKETERAQAIPATDDSGIKTLFESIDLVDILDKKRAAAFEQAFRRGKEQVLLEKEITKELERETRLLTIQAEGNKELFALKEKQFELEDRLGRKLSENETLKVQAFITETEQLKKTIAENEKTGQQITQIWEAVGRGTEDAIVNALTGASSALEGFRSIALAILEDITRQIIRTSVITPLFGGEGGLFSNISLPGFAHGGSFTVPGSGGTDSSPVSFMATPGERVDIRTPGQMADGHSENITIVQNIQTGVAQTVRAEMLQLAPQIIELARQGVFDANRRGGRLA